ncbi:hypothetical protein EDC04DRAFT_2608926 [Pisolithus marmoratus]|nr:hypothetical protein EDC04DRAFT_2608926 [Pisolithus marmoratus]
MYYNVHYDIITVQPLLLFDVLGLWWNFANILPKKGDIAKLALKVAEAKLSVGIRSAQKGSVLLMIRKSGTWPVLDSLPSLDRGGGLGFWELWSSVWPVLARGGTFLESWGAWPADGCQGCSCTCLDGDPSSTLYLASTLLVWGMIVLTLSVPAGVGQQIMGQQMLICQTWSMPACAIYPHPFGSWGYLVVIEVAFFSDDLPLLWGKGPS